MTEVSVLLEEARRLSEAATPAPWSFYLDDLWSGMTAELLAEYDANPDRWDELPAGMPAHLFHGDPVRAEDAAFIAWCRDGVPALIAALEQAKADTLNEFVADIENIFPSLREHDEFSDWSKGVGFAVDRARMTAQLALPESPYAKASDLVLGTHEQGPQA